MTTPESTRSRRVRIEVDLSHSPERLDRYLADRPEIDLTRSRIQTLIADGLVTVNGEIVPKNHRVRGGEAVAVTIPPPTGPHLDGEDIPLDIVYEDEHLVVVNKPAGMVTHPAPGSHRGTLVNAMIHHLGSLPEGGGTDRPGIVHRLDKNTSGLLVVARSEDTHRALQKAVRERLVKRTYLALVCGNMASKEGSIELPIGRSRRDRKRMTVSGRGRAALTHYTRRDRFRSYDLLEVKLHTGRTHQIRVHFSYRGHPVFGDPDYGGRHKWLRGMFGPERPLARRLLETMDRQALHASRLEFVHPVTGKTLRLTSDPPEDFRAVLALLDREGR